MVLPLIPIPVSAITDRSTIRSLLEFFAWFDDMPEAESKLLCETREHYVKLYMARAGDGPGWCDDRQSFKLPISLSGSGRSTYKSRRWGPDLKAYWPSTQRRRNTGSHSLRTI
jgi:hypothetical protein